MHAGVFDHAEPDHRSRSRNGPCCLPTLIRRRHPRELSFAAQWPACTIPYRRFATALTDDNARLGASVARYAFAVEDSHLLLLAGLPAHIKQRDRAFSPCTVWVKMLQRPESGVAVQHGCFDRRAAIRNMLPVLDQLA
jgi:hypothetical protein